MKESCNTTRQIHYSIPETVTLNCFMAELLMQSNTEFIEDSGDELIWED